MGLVRKISHLLAAFADNATDFKRRWKLPSPSPTRQNGLQGRWEGEWISDVNRHRGPLRCLLDRTETGDYTATFHAVYAKFLRVSYKVPLHAQWTGEKLKLEGEMDLGSLAGGVYNYSGEAREDEFVCSYHCKYDHGAFRMKPVEGSPQP